MNAAQNVFHLTESSFSDGLSTRKKVLLLSLGGLTITALTVMPALMWWVELTKNQGLKYENCKYYSFIWPEYKINIPSINLCAKRSSPVNISNSAIMQFNLVTNILGVLGLFSFAHKMYNEFMDNDRTVSSFVQRFHDFKSSLTATCARVAFGIVAILYLVAAAASNGLMLSSKLVDSLHDCQPFTPPFPYDPVPLNRNFSCQSGLEEQYIKLAWAFYAVAFIANTLSVIGWYYALDTAKAVGRKAVLCCPFLALSQRADQERLVANTTPAASYGSTEL